MYFFHMRVIKNIIFFASVLPIIRCTNSFKESLVDSYIMTTEAVLRNVTNNLFASLKLKRHNPRLNQYLLVNKYFSSLTLQDHDCLNKIAEISRTNHIKNIETIDFMTAINELLDDDNRDIVKNKIYNEIEIEKCDDRVVHIIEIFLRSLKEAKELHEINSYVKIDENVLNVIKGANANTTSQGRQHESLHNEIESGEPEFWIPGSRRIYKGDRTKIKHYPFMASIQMFNNFQCGGSIIKSDLVITASSCLQLAWNNRFYRENPAFLSVRVGSSFYSAGGEVIPVLEVYFHPAYNPRTLKNNICILRLIRKISFSWRDRRRVRKIVIDRQSYSLSAYTPGITILGWGARGQSNILRNPWENVLSFAVLDVYPLKECQEFYSKSQSNSFEGSKPFLITRNCKGPRVNYFQGSIMKTCYWLITNHCKIYRKYVTQKNFCAGFMSKGGGACNRDVGDPGVYGKKLVGVVSFGSPVCGTPDAPTVFTKLGYYTDWIDTIMAQDVPHTKKKTTIKPTVRPISEFIMRDNPTRSTTFKIAPLSETLQSVPVTESELESRLFDDKVFKEFLGTVFKGKEITKYENLFNEAKQNMDSRIIKEDDPQLNIAESTQITSPYIDFDESVTRFLEYEGYTNENEETTTQSDNSNKYTLLDDDIISVTEKVDYNIEDSINNIDLNKFVDAESNDVNKGMQANDFKESIISTMDSLHDATNRNESVLTLFYLSDEYNDKVENIARSQEDGKAMNIAADSSPDLTRTQSSNEDLLSVLPEKELYEILSEVIDESIKE